MAKMRSHHGGFSLIELMIGVALGLVILAALTSFFVNASANRHEIERTSRQIENGRFAIDGIRNEVHLAGFYAELQQTGATWQLADPCATTAAGLGVAFGPPLSLPLPISGYTPDVAIPACATDWVKGTDILVIRRFNTEVTPVASAAAAQFYFQPSRCATDSTTKPWAFDLGSNQGNFDLHKVSCGGNLADLYRFRVTLFYIRSWSLTAGDNVPTLVRLDLDNGAIATTPLVEGIADMRLEYGLDTNVDGAPDSYSRCDTKSPCTPDQWSSVTAVRVYLLAINLEPTLGWKETKVYDMGSGDPRTVGPFGDNIKRHVYAAVISAPNRTGPRE